MTPIPSVIHRHQLPFQEGQPSGRTELRRYSAGSTPALRLANGTVVNMRQAPNGEFDYRLFSPNVEVGLWAQQNDPLLHESVLKQRFVSAFIFFCTKFGSALKLNLNFNMWFWTQTWCWIWKFEFGLRPEFKYWIWLSLNSKLSHIWNCKSHGLAEIAYHLNLNFFVNFNFKAIFQPKPPLIFSLQVWAREISIDTKTYLNIFFALLRWTVYLRLCDVED